jgi:germination protein M
MNHRVVWIVASAVLLLAILAWLFSGGWGGSSGDVVEIADLPTPTPAPEQRVTLLFSGYDGLLHPELRTVPLPVEVHERVRVVARELLSGPDGNLGPIVPWPAELHAVFIDDDRTAFIDITAPPEAVTGSHIELMLAYGLVDSILLNCPELKAVQILFGGHEVPTLTGHLDLSRPLVFNKRFIAS